MLVDLSYRHGSLPSISGLSISLAEPVSQPSSPSRNNQAYQKQYQQYLNSSNDLLESYRNVDAALMNIRPKRGGRHSHKGGSPRKPVAAPRRPSKILPPTLEEDIQAYQTKDPLVSGKALLDLEGDEDVEAFTGLMTFETHSTSADRHSKSLMTLPKLPSPAKPYTMSEKSSVQSSAQVSTSTTPKAGKSRQQHADHVARVMPTLQGSLLEAIACRCRYYPAIKYDTY